MTEPAFLGAYGITYRWKSHLGALGYSGSRSCAVDEVSFEVDRGEIIALLGPNGSGKSTLLKAVAGILPFHSAAFSGDIRHLGQSFLSIPPQRRVQKIAYVGSDLRAEFPMTTQEAVYLGRKCQSSNVFRRTSREDQEEVQKAMERCLCWDLRDRDLQELSGGERQLVTLARALAQGARILFLDEALSKMDLHHQAAMGRLLQGLAKEGYSILLVSHDVNFACEWSQSAILMKDGKKVAQGAIQDVLTTQNLQILYPGADLVIYKNRHN